MVVLLGQIPGLSGTGMAVAGQQIAMSPTSYTVERGSASDQGVAVLAKENQRGSMDNWSEYLEFYSAGRGSVATFHFEIPVDFVGQKLDSGTLRVNFKGHDKEYQAWKFYARNQNTNRWVKVMDNRRVSSWRWSVISATLPGDAANYIDPLGRMQIRMRSPKADDNVNIDSMRITLEAAETSSEPVTSPPVAVTPDTPATTTPPVVETPPTTTVTAPPVVETPPTTTVTAPPVVETPPTTTVTAPPVVETPPTTTVTAPPVVETPPTESDGVWKAEPGTSWQIQFTGNRDISFDVEMYDLDLFDTPTSVISQLQNEGRVVICYFSGGTWENWRSDAGQFPDSVLGANLADWPGERWLDVGNINALAPIMRARLDLAVEKGCDGVDPDNMDGYSNPNGFSGDRLDAADQLAYNKWIADEAHARGLAIGLKNDLGQVAQLEPYYDFAINESCNQYNECDLLSPFVEAGKAVFGIEYTGNAGTICSEMNDLDFDFLFKSRSLDASREACR